MHLWDFVLVYELENLVSISTPIGSKLKKTKQKQTHPTQQDFRKLLFFFFRLDFTMKITAVDKIHNIKTQKGRLQLLAQK